MEDLFQLVRTFKEVGLRENINLVSIEKFKSFGITNDEFKSYCNDNGIKIEFIESNQNDICLPNYIINILD